MLSVVRRDHRDSGFLRPFAGFLHKHTTLCYSQPVVTVVRNRAQGIAFAPGGRCWINLFGTKPGDVRSHHVGHAVGIDAPYVGIKQDIGRGFSFRLRHIQRLKNVFDRLAHDSLIYPHGDVVGYFETLQHNYSPVRPNKVTDQ